MPCFDRSFLVTCKVDKAFQFAWHICNCSLKRTEKKILWITKPCIVQVYIGQRLTRRCNLINMYHNVFTCVFLKWRVWSWVRDGSCLWKMKQRTFLTYINTVIYFHKQLPLHDNNPSTTAIILGGQCIHSLWLVSTSLPIKVAIVERYNCKENRLICQFVPRNLINYILF